MRDLNCISYQSSDGHELFLSRLASTTTVGCLTGLLLIATGSGEAIGEVVGDEVTYEVESTARWQPTKHAA